MEKVFGDSVVYCLPNFLKVLYKERDVFSSCELAGRLVHSYSALDRTEVLLSRCPSTVIDLIPSIENTKPKEFDELCLSRAKEILSCELPVNIYWSGGIDSTTALVSLILVATEENKLDQINVKLQATSIIEYPLFFETYVKKMNYEIVDMYFRRMIDFENYTVVTGELGDQLFGSMVLDIFEDDKNKNWTEIFDSDKYFQFDGEIQDNAAMALKNSKRVRNFLREHLENQVSKCPIEIKTVFDLYWWLNFSLKWNDVTFRTFAYKTSLNKSYYENLQHFFQTEDFQIWSMLNHDKKIKNDWRSYKYVMKDFIYQFTNDADYRDNKLKEQSGHSEKSGDLLVNTLDKRRKLINTNQIVIAIDNNIEPILMYDLFTYQNEVTDKYKIDFDDENFIKWEG